MRVLPLFSWFKIQFSKEYGLFRRGPCVLVYIGHSFLFLLGTPFRDGFLPSGSWLILVKPCFTPPTTVICPESGFIFTHMTIASTQKILTTRPISFARLTKKVFPRLRLAFCVEVTVVIFIFLKLRNSDNQHLQARVKGKVLQKRLWRP